MPQNILNENLQACSIDQQQKKTGFSRNNFCEFSPNDGGRHLVCAEMDESFLNFSKLRGNDLTGHVKPGERWCLCEERWNEAFENGKAPKVIAESTNSNIKAITLKNIQKALEGETIQSNPQWRRLKKHISYLCARYPSHSKKLRQFFNKSYSAFWASHHTH